LEHVPIRSASDLALLADEWNALARRCPGYLLSQTHRWAEVAWEIIAQPRGRKLAGVALRSEGRLVAVWPLITYGELGARVVRPLGSEATEYCVPLVEPGADCEARLSALWQAAVRHADIVMLPFLPTGSPLDVLLQRERQRRIATATSRAIWVARGDYPDWKGYEESVSAQHRAELRRKRRRLADHGTVGFSELGAEQAAELINWILDHKRRWLERRNLANEWLQRSDYRDFLVALASRPLPLGRVSLFVLALDGVPVAAQLNIIDGTRVESLIATYDDRYSRFSVGNIVNDECLRWALERGLDFDFRLGDQSFKLVWAKRQRDIASFQVLTGARGWPLFAFLHARAAVERARFKLGLGRFFRARLRDRSGQPSSTER
jgi:CelD/BcsL family acetyltransferase involved in cellulose biosynthesis